MTILWVTNSIFPDVYRALGKTPSPFGGWQFGLAKDLVAQNITLVVATARKNMEPFHKEINNIEYFLLKTKKLTTHYDQTLESQWKEVIKKTNPDLVHIHGTEHAHGLALVKSCPELKYIFSIQGLISIYDRYYTAGISTAEILKNITLRDLIKGDGILASQRNFRERGNKIEKNYFKLINAIIGRTEWDKHHALTLNKDCTYHFCNESLRDSFYKESKWDINTKEDFSIFLSQAGYPIKGFHQVLKAIALLTKEFPEVKVKFAGSNVLSNNNSLKNRLQLKGYGRYLRRLVCKLSLEDNLEYLGILSEKRMHEEYLKAHIFICPSSIENSPNSLGEAQLLGVPSIAAYVGGIPDMVEHEETGLLYRFEEVEMLAQHIKSIFRNHDLANRLSKNEMAVASKRHDRQENAAQLINIYKSLTQQ